MKVHIFYILLFLSTSSIVLSQEVVNMPERTPEQEASSQTDRLQKELNLSPEQTKRVYEINLHYARQRQQSNSRTEATQRIRNKNEDLKKILTKEQYEKLQNKHYSRYTYSEPNKFSSEVNSAAKPASDKNRLKASSSQPLSSSAYRSTQEEKERKDKERAAVRYYPTHRHKIDDDEEVTKTKEATLLPDRKNYNNEPINRPAEKSSPSPQQRIYNNQSISPNNNSRSSSSSYTTPPINEGSNSSSGNSSSNNPSSSSRSDNKEQ